MDKRFTELTGRIARFMFRSLGLTVCVGVLVVATPKLWPFTATMTGKLPRREPSGAWGQAALGMADLFYLIGPSGAGKDSLIAYARANLDGCPPVIFAHRYITRPASAGGENHVALGDREFRCRREQGCFSLWWESHGFRYGLGREVELWLGNGLHVVVNGSRGALAEADRAFPRLRPVLVRAEPETIAERLRRRGRESKAEIAQRLTRTRTLGEPRHPRLVTIDNDGPIEIAGQALLRLLRVELPR